MDEAIPSSQEQNNSLTNNNQQSGNNPVSNNNTEMLEAGSYIGSDSWGLPVLDNINPEPGDVNAMDVSAESSTASTSPSENSLGKRERDDINSSFDNENDSHKDKKSKK